MAECHIIGQLVSGYHFPGNSLFCKYEIHFGESWKLISGLKDGQTQLDSPQLDGKTYWSHPIDLHLVTKSVQGWPKIHLEVYHEDTFGRNELSGYGFTYLPTCPGNHQLTCATWRPTGSLKDDIKKFFLGGGMQLKKSDIVYNGADRYKIQTETMGEVYLDINGFQTLANFKIHVGEENGDCNNEMCLNNTFDQFSAGNLTSVSEKSRESDQTLHESFYFFTLFPESNNDDENTRRNKNEYITESSTNSNSNESEMFDITNNVAEITSSHPFSTSPSIPTTTQIINQISTSGSSKSHEFNLKNIDMKNVCFCDLKVNECDINCCCDEDCHPFHYRIFTKCVNQNYVYDINYCYQSSFILRNNTSYRVVKNNAGLFCIVKDNLKIGSNYEVKPFITKLEDFNKTLPLKKLNFSYKFRREEIYTNKNYVAGSPIWIIQNGDLTSFRIDFSSVGILCNSKSQIKYLIEESKDCFYHQQYKTECEKTKMVDMIRTLMATKIISNPSVFNRTHFILSKACESNDCLGITMFLCPSKYNKNDCIKIAGNSKGFSQISCTNALSHVQFWIWHNGSKGIFKVEAYIWVTKLPKTANDILTRLTTEVKFVWFGSEKNVFKRSGNPGYLTGKPIFLGKKVYNLVNGTSDKKEAIEMSNDSKDWLSVLGSVKGFCSSRDRIPVKFRENGQFMCSLKLNKNNFTKEKCNDLQMNIYKLLVGSDVLTQSKENYLNKFVATFGNSKVEETADWVQVLIDFSPVISSQASLKANYHRILCKNMITDLYINVIYSNIGSFLAPQAKILGVSLDFGDYKDLTYICDTQPCENSTSSQYFKLSTSINFVDVTKPAVEAFAEPLKLETKLPHDFFYPFFSKSEKNKVSKFFLIFLTVIHFISLICTEF